MGLVNLPELLKTFIKAILNRDKEWVRLALVLLCVTARLLDLLSLFGFGLFPPLAHV